MARDFLGCDHPPGQRGHIDVAPGRKLEAHERTGKELLEAAGHSGHMPYETSERGAENPDAIVCGGKPVQLKSTLESFQQAPGKPASTTVKNRLQDLDGKDQFLHYDARHLDPEARDVRGGVSRAVGTDDLANCRGMAVVGNGFEEHLSRHEMDWVTEHHEQYKEHGLPRALDERAEVGRGAHDRFAVDEPGRGTDRFEPDPSLDAGGGHAAGDRFTPDPGPETGGGPEPG